MKKDKSKIISAGAVSLSALALVLAMTGCSSSNNDGQDYAQFCVKKDSQERVDDSKCDGVDDNNHSANGSVSPFIWGFLASSIMNNGTNTMTSFPAVGQRVDSQYSSGFSTSKPESGYAVKGVPKTSGSTSSSVSAGKSSGKGTSFKSDSKGGSGSGSKGGSGSGSKGGGGSKGGFGGGGKSGGMSGG